MAILNIRSSASISNFQLILIYKLMHLIEIFFIKNINISNGFRVNDSFYDVPGSVETKRRVENEQFEESAPKVNGGQGNQLV